MSKINGNIQPNEIKKIPSKKESPQMKKDKTWSGNENHKEYFFDQKARTNISWDFDFMTIGDEEPNIILANYLKGFGSFKTKSELEKMIVKKQKKKTMKKDGR